MLNINLRQCQLCAMFFQRRVRNDTEYRWWLRWLAGDDSCRTACSSSSISLAWMLPLVLYRTSYCSSNSSDVAWQTVAYAAHSDWPADRLHDCRVISTRRCAATHRGDTNLFLFVSDVPHSSSLRSPSNCKSKDLWRGTFRRCTSCMESAVNWLETHTFDETSEGFLFRVTCD